MFKSIGVMIVVICMWVTYTVIENDSCSRIHRAAGPVRVVMSALQMAVNPWGNLDQRWMVTTWLIKADLMTQKFIARQFYDASIFEFCNRPDPNSEDQANKKHKDDADNAAAASAANKGN
jgi:hypothetical protein